MKNVEPHKNEQLNEPNWLETPLFAQNVEPQIDKFIAETLRVSAPSETDSESFEQSNVVPQTVSSPLMANDLPPQHNSSAFQNSNLSEVQNVEPRQKKNAELHSVNKAASRHEENVVPLILQEAPQPKKPRRKPPVRKIRSQKRNVVPLKLFVSPTEKNELEVRAGERNCSLSNYIRLNLGLAPNEAGRKKQNVTAAFDLSEFDLED